MARIDTFDIAPEDEEKFFKYLKWGNRFVNERIISKERPLSRQGTADVIETSYLGTITLLWDSLTQGERDAWASAAFYSGQTGYSLFVQDTSYRLKNSIAGVSTPSDYHQYKVGKIVIPPAAQDQILYQYHPANYNIARKITGTQNSYEPVAITETFGFPLDYAINYKADLVGYGASPWARMYIQIVYNDGAGEVTVNYYTSLSLVTDWAYITGTIASFPHTVVRYYYMLYFNDVAGDFFFDVPEVDYDSQNFALDANCDIIGDNIPALGVTINTPWRNLYPDRDATIVSKYFPE